MDIVNKQTRSRMMSGIRGKDTKPELALRRALHAAGFRYRLHFKGLPGRPDIVLARYHAVVFAHGCYWHRHAGCRFATTPATRTDFWMAKFSKNTKRDLAAQAQLRDMGWRVATVWECALKKPDHVDQAAAALASWLKSDSMKFEFGSEDLDAPPA